MINPQEIKNGDILVVDRTFQHQHINSKFRAGDEFRVDAVVEICGEPIIYATCTYLTPGLASENRLKLDQTFTLNKQMPVFQHLYVSLDKKAYVGTRVEVMHRHIEIKRKLAAQCNYYYPIFCTDKNGTQQVAAAQTPGGAATIKETLERRNPENDYSIGARSIVMSDELIMLEFEPTPAERIAIHEKSMAMLAACYGFERPTPERAKKMLEGIDG